MGNQIELEIKNKDTKPVKTTKKNWEESYQILEEFVQEFGRLPRQTETYRGNYIGRWYMKQVNDCKKANYPETYKVKLEAIEDIKNTPDLKWEHQYHVLQRFIDEYQRLPRRNETYNGENIGEWYASKENSVKKKIIRKNENSCCGK